MQFSEITNFFVSLIVISNPLVSLPALLSLCQGRPLDEKKRTGVVAAFAVAVIFMVVIWFGKPLLDFLSIGIPAFQVAGSIVLFLIGLSMLNAKVSAIKSTAEEQQATIQKDSIAIVPLATPLMAGPGAISVVLMHVSVFPSVMDHIYLSIGGLLVAAFLGVILYFATTIERVLGVTWINVINRLAGLILAAMAVELFARGMIGLFPFLGEI